MRHKICVDLQNPKKTISFIAIYVQYTVPGLLLYSMCGKIFLSGF